MFKKTGIILSLVILFVLVAGVAHADNPGNVVDYLNYLTADEIEWIKGDIDSIRSNYGLDVVLVITDNTEGKTSMEFADDFYDYNGYGVGSDYSGLLMLINMQEREVCISTTGKAIDIFTDRRLDIMIDNITNYLTNRQYYKAGTTFIGDVRHYAQSGVPENQYRLDTSIPDQTNRYREYDSYYPSYSYLDRVFDLATSWLVYIIALALAIGITLAFTFSSKGKVTINSLTYEENGSFGLSASRDDFIRQSVTKTKIESSSSGGGGGRSSTHRGSSGRSHGGRGGRF